VTDNPTRHRFLINRDYARLWYGQTISSLGDVFFSTTLVLWVADVLAKDQPWAPAAVSGILLSVGAAILLAGPIAGVFVDRWDRMRTLLGTEVIRGVIAVLLTIIVLLPVSAAPVWALLTLIYVAVFCLHTAGQFFNPARLAVISDIVPGEADRARAAGIGQGTAGAIAMVGPPLAAPLLFSVGIQWALLLNAASYALSYVAIRSVRGRPTASPVPSGPASSRTSLRQEFLAGLRFFARSRFLIALLVLAVIGQGGMGVLNTLNLFFLTENLGAPSRMFGYLGTAEGIGGIIGALCAGWVVQRIGSRRTAWLGLVVGGILLLIYTRQTAFLGGLTVLFLFIVPITMLNTAMMPLLLAAAPKEYLGRVIAVFMPVTQLAMMLCAITAGWLASSPLRDFGGTFAGLRFGRIDTILAFAGLLIVLAGIYAWRALPATPEPADPPATPEPVRIYRD
jgi:MFS family permease